jgi:glutathione peroxidase
MKIIILITTVIITLSCATNKEKGLSEHGKAANGEYSTIGTKTEKESTMNLHNFKVTDINGKEFDMASLKGKKVLIVNTASECGLTPQYEQLEELYKKYGGAKFEIIGFPANNFGAQEPGADTTIAAFCKKNYGVTFRMMSKISVKGDDQHELYQWLTKKEKNGVEDASVSWNFQKFLIDENGNYVKSVSPRTLPTDESIVSWIKG